MSSSSLSMAGSHGNSGWIPYDIGIMIIDEDPLSLLFVHTMLETCHYRVVSFSDPVEALHEICKKRVEFDLVIADLHMITMPGFSFVERIAKGLKLPVITTCADEEPDLLHQALNCGACFHLVKPITINNMEFVWKKSWRNRANGQLEPLRLMKVHNEGDGLITNEKRPLQIGSSSSFKLVRDETNYSRKKDYKRERDEDLDSEDHVRTRLQWDCELHKRFLVAVSMLGTDAVPTSIIGIMNVTGLTIEQVASHLQKHRKRLLKEKQMKDKERFLTNLITAQKFPTCLAPTNCKKTNNQSLLMSNQMNQEVMQRRSLSSSVRRTPFILPIPSTTANSGEGYSTILQQHNLSFQNTPPIFPSTNQWFNIQNDPIGNASTGRSTLLQNWTSQVHGFNESSQTSTPSILNKSFTNLMNCDSYCGSYNDISQFMNFEFTRIENNINMGNKEKYNVGFQSNLDDPLQIGSSLYGNLDSTTHNVNVMKEPVMLDAANEWPSMDKFLCLNNELQFASQKDFVVPGGNSSTNFDFGCDFNNFRDLTFDDAFLAEMLNDIDKGGAA